MPTKIITEPGVEPVTLADAKQYLRVSGTDEDALILRLIATARRRAEKLTWRALCTQTIDYVLDEFHCRVIELPAPPLQSVTHVKYFDLNGTEQTMDSSLYQVDTISEPGRIAPAYLQVWPSTRDQMNAVTVRMVCGYGGTAQVPPDIANAVLLMVGHYYEHREEVSDFEKFPVPNSAECLLETYRSLRF